MLKKIIFLSILYIVVSSVSVCAQFGIRAGVNAAKLSRSTMGGQTEHKMGVGIGIFSEIPVFRNLSIQPEINYMQQGTKETGNFTGGTLVASKNINYLQFPVLFKYNFDNGLFIQTGPYWGIGLGNIVNDICFNGDCHSSKSGFDSGGKEGTLRYDHGFQLGTGYKITKNISIDLRLIVGLKNIYVKPYGGALNSGINISGSYSI